MRKFVRLIAALCLGPLATPGVAAESAWTVVVKHEAAPARSPAIERYGPFEVIDEATAALVDVTDNASPAQFAAMLSAHPGLRVLQMVDCPGTEDDVANLRLGRMIRAAGLGTAVPRGGSVRSGAVELFLAGVDRHIDAGAEFAVHAWQDESGQQPADYAADAPENRRYLTYYREMGMDAGQASAFYAMTNSAPFEQPLWLTGKEMAKWVGSQPTHPQPKLVYLDLGPALP